jgi:hypothetical protein
MSRTSHNNEEADQRANPNFRAGNFKEVKGMEHNTPKIVCFMCNWTFCQEDLRSIKRERCPCVRVLEE